MTLIQAPVMVASRPFWTANAYARPVVSRRHGGLALEINLTPGCSCNLNCVYCSEDGCAERAPDVDLDQLSEELETFLTACAADEIFNYSPLHDTPDHLRQFVAVTFGGTGAGGGEPTMSPYFADAVTMVAEALARHELSDAKIVLETNASLLHRRGVIDAVRTIEQQNGEIWCKLNAGSETLFNQIVRAPVPMARVLTNITQAGRRRAVVIQSRFFNLAERGLGRAGARGPGEEELEQYLRRLNDLLTVGCRIKLVQVGTISRSSRPRDPHPRGVWPLEEEVIDRIAGRVRSTGLAVAAFYQNE